MLVLVGDDRLLDVRGSQLRFDLCRVGQHVEALDADPAHHLTAAGVDPLKAAVWSLLGEWGNPTDHESRDALIS